MTNDNAPAAKPIEDRFSDALSELIGMCMDAGMHPKDMIPRLEKEVRWCRETCARIDREGTPSP